MPLNTQPGVPHKGWTLPGVTDLQLDEGRAFGEYEDCEFCGHEQIRFVHTLTHGGYLRSTERAFGQHTSGT